MKRSKSLPAVLMGLSLLCGAPVMVPSAHALAAQNEPYSQAQLDRMLAPIALYPDALLSQVLMAATYPLEVIEAARWSRANPGLRGDDAVRAVQDRDWDPSVKSLVAFPNILQRMDENLEWTRALGEAFLEQEPYVMDTVQQLRQRARAAGNLAPDERLRVVEDRGRLIIEPARPEIVYVPYYDPWVVYGSWWWPSHPPVVWAPWPGYTVVTRYYGPRPVFAWGPAVQVSVGFFFGGVDWHRRHVEVVRVNNYYVNRTVVVREGRHAPVRVIRPGRWEHDPAHRRGVSYADPALSRRFPGAHRGFDGRDDERDRRRAEERRDDRQAGRNDRERAVPDQRFNSRSPDNIGTSRPIVSNQPDPRFDSRSPDNIRSARPSVSSVAPNSADQPPTGAPSPARQMQLQQERERRRADRREAREPSPARQQQLQQEREPRSETRRETPLARIERREQSAEHHPERREAPAARIERREERAEQRQERHEVHQDARHEASAAQAERRREKREAREERKEKTAQR